MSLNKHKKCSHLASNVDSTVNLISLWNNSNATLSLSPQNNNEEPMPFELWPAPPSPVPTQVSG